MNLIKQNAGTCEETEQFVVTVSLTNGGPCPLKFSTWKNLSIIQQASTVLRKSYGIFNEINDAESVTPRTLQILKLILQ